MEVFEENLPVRWQAMKLELPNRKRQGVIDAHESGRIGRQSLREPVREVSHLLGWSDLGSTIDSQVLETRVRGLRAGLVDSQVSPKDRSLGWPVVFLARRQSAPPICRERLHDVAQTQPARRSDQREH